jgi:hypothetical protein
MDKALWDRLAAAGGIVGVLLFVVGIIVIGSPPEISDDATTVVGFFQDNRSQVLWGTFFMGLGVLALIWFVSALGAAMRNAGEGRLAAALGLAFAITFSIGAVSALVRAALAYNVADVADASTVIALYHSAAALDTISGTIGAGMFVAVAGAAVRTAFVPTWWGWLSGLAGLWVVVSSTAWGRDGFWSPDGAGFVTFLVFLAWALVTSVLLTLKVREAG